MGEMTLRDKHESEVRRAVDVLAKREYLGRKRWDYDEIEGKAVACDYGAPPIWVDGFVAIAVAEKLERDAAPPADAGEGDADLEIAISKLRATTAGRLESEEFRLTDDSATHLVEDLVGLRFTTRELDALAAAAERGVGPGPATRKVAKWLAEGYADDTFDGTVWINGHFDRHPINRWDVACFLRELGLEAPR